MTDEDAQTRLRPLRTLLAFYRAEIFALHRIIDECGDQ
jgi:hypothetical protein